MKKVIPTLLVLLLTGCGSQPQKPVQEVQPAKDSFPSASVQGRALYLLCTGGYAFPVNVQKDEAWIFLPEGAKRLVRTETEDGVKYSNGEYSLWGRGNNGMFQVEDKPAEQCRNQPQKAVWVESKLRGADFRAVGNEPGWTLELSLEGNTVFVSDYGKTRALFKTTEPVTDASKRTSTYRLNNGQQQITVQIEGKACNDSISGEPFDTSVTVHYDDQTYKGCGKAL